MKTSPMYRDALERVRLPRIQPGFFLGEPHVYEVGVIIALLSETRLSPPIVVARLEVADKLEPDATPTFARITMAEYIYSAKDARKLILSLETLVRYGEKLEGTLFRLHKAAAGRSS